MCDCLTTQLPVVLVHSVGSFQLSLSLSILTQMGFSPYSSSHGSFKSRTYTCKSKHHEHIYFILLQRDMHRCWRCPITILQYLQKNVSSIAQAVLEICFSISLSCMYGLPNCLAVPMVLAPHATTVLEGRVINENVVKWKRFEQN
jgi:hypothetical protein